jgi:hypothetical protein
MQSLIQKIWIAVPRRAIGHFPIYPIVFAAVFPLNLYESNFDLFPQFVDVLRPLAVLVLFALAMTVLFGAGMRNMQRGGVAAVILVYVLTYHARAMAELGRIIQELFGASPPEAILALPIIALICLLFIFVRPTASATRIVNAAALAILVYHAVVLVQIDARELPPEATAATAAERRDFALASAGASRPDIYHIVLDGYARADVLAESYGFDNSRFIRRLENLGFAVADRAVSPYNRTLEIMNSVFYGRYLPEQTSTDAVSERVYRDILSDQFQRNLVTTALSDMGYTLATTKSEFQPLEMNQADVVFNDNLYGFTVFERTVYGRTLIPWVLESLGFLNSTSSRSKMRESFAVPLWAELPKPFFAYVHILAPHPPFDLDENGERIAMSTSDIFTQTRYDRNIPEKVFRFRDGYVNKLRVVNDEVYAYVKRILAESPDPKIIIIHGDHGGGIFMDLRDAAGTCHKERMSPMVAVYSSDGALQRALPDDLNIINLYRVVFNTYFGTDMPLRPSESMFVNIDDPTRRTSISPEELRETCSLETLTGTATVLSRAGR